MYDIPNVINNLKGMILDKATREAVSLAVKKAVMEANEVYNEVWLTSEQLCEQVPLFKREWLRHNYNKLPNERVAWKDAQGVEHSCGRCFPKKRILRMVAEGAFRNMAID